MGKRIVNERALRIMEALSGTDTALLERCECEQQNRMVNYSSQSKRRHGKYNILGGESRGHSGKYAGVWAAGLCLMAVSALSWGGYALTTRVNNMSGGMSNDAAQLQSMAIEVTDSGMEAAGEIQGQEWEAQPEEVFGYSEGSGHNTGDGDSYSRAPAGGFAGEAQNTQNTADKEKQELKNDELKNDELEKEAVRAPDKTGIELTEAEARGIEILGSYVPASLPDGYVFDTACYNADTEEKNLTIHWTRGMDYIDLNIMTAGDLPATVDVNRPETYDERLYEIPYAETVPAEYRESVDNPVFAMEDLSLKVIESRMISVGDRGDTATPRGNFGVLYPDGVLLQFRGRGTAEEIFLLLSCVRPGR